MRIFQNKFFLICLCIALVFTIVPSVFSIMGYRSLAKNIVGTVTMPVRWVATTIGNAVQGWGKYFGNMKALNKENEALIEENKALKEQLQNAELLERENERLRDYLDMKNKYPSFAMEEGMIISHSSGNYITNFTLNRGTLHGIETNMPVITKDGIVGYVVEVGLNWCMVSTLIETATSVGAYIPRSEVVGIVSGDYSMRQEGTCKIGYIDAEADVQVGDTVYSSGTGSVYPADLKIGTVTSIEVDEYNRTLVATVTPAVDFSSLKWVMVITGYENNSGMQ
ncbi:MAG: rod shape-determining protein MreC [Ruminococcaceae bacterium]|nr:rod shape-determining protein MreC [Oscillospiraceae bacterium]